MRASGLGRSQLGAPGGPHLCSELPSPTPCAGHPAARTSQRMAALRPPGTPPGWEQAGATRPEGGRRARRGPRRWAPSRTAGQDGRSLRVQGGRGAGHGGTGYGGAGHLGPGGHWHKGHGGAGPWGMGGCPHEGRGGHPFTGRAAVESQGSGGTCLDLPIPQAALTPVWALLPCPWAGWGGAERRGPGCAVQGWEAVARGHRQLCASADTGL